MFRRSSDGFVALNPQSIRVISEFVVTNGLEVVILFGDCRSLNEFSATDDSGNASVEETEAFVRSITSSQNQLFAYVFSLIGDHSRAADVVQETNLVLWRKRAEFDSRRPFLPWACAVARFQVLAHIRDHSRDRVLSDPEIVEAIATEAESQAAEFEPVQVALRKCIQRLSEFEQELIASRYQHRISVADIAKNADKGISAIKVSLMRTRAKLGECVQARMAGKEATDVSPLT